MSRIFCTEFLSKLLEKEKFIGLGEYYAKEVTFDYGTDHTIRVDYIQFKPLNQISIDGLEKGEFICYEIKSCVEDFNSGNGLNFIGEKNYLVTDITTYIKLMNKGQLNKLPLYIGILVAVPKGSSAKDELETPTQITENCDIGDWTLIYMRTAKKTYRRKSMIEMLFCMLRSHCNNLTFNLHLK